MAKVETIAELMVDAIEDGASPEDLIVAFQQECEKRCPAHAPSFLERMKSAIDAFFN